MFKGDIIILSSKDELLANSSGNMVLFMSLEMAKIENLIQITNGIEVSILVPPYEALSEEVNNNLLGFNAIYFQHLATNPIAQKIIALILKSLIVGKNVIIYLTPGEAEMWYSSSFIEFMRTAYGLTISTSIGIESMWDFNYKDIILTTIFLNDLLDPLEYLNSYSLNSVLPIESIVKLSNVLNPVLPNNIYDTQSYITHFDNLRRNIQSTGVKLTSPFRRNV